MLQVIKHGNTYIAYNSQHRTFNKKFKNQINNYII